jgi:hypothetical protein
MSTGLLFGYVPLRGANAYKNLVTVGNRSGNGIRLTRRHGIGQHNGRGSHRARGGPHGGCERA